MMYLSAWQQVSGRQRCISPLAWVGGRRLMPHMRHRRKETTLGANRATPSAKHPVRRRPGANHSLLSAVREVPSLSTQDRARPLEPRERFGYSPRHVYEAPETPAALPLGLVMKVRNSLKSLRNRHRDNRLVRRKGRVYIINKTQKRYKARQG